MSYDPSGTQIALMQQQVGLMQAQNDLLILIQKRLEVLNLLAGAGFPVTDDVEQLTEDVLRPPS